MATVDPAITRVQEEPKKMEQQLASLSSLTYDTDLYGGSDHEAYVTSIPVTEDDDALDALDSEVARKLASYTGPKSILKEMPHGGGEEDGDLGIKKSQRIIDREDGYRKRRLNRVISPDKHDAFATGDKTPDVSVRTYAIVMRVEALKRMKEATLTANATKKKEEEEAAKAGGSEKEECPAAQKRRNRWDQSHDDGEAGVGVATAKKAKMDSDWDLPDSNTGIGRWDATPTPGRIGDTTPSAMTKHLPQGEWPIQMRRLGQQLLVRLPLE